MVMKVKNRSGDIIPPEGDTFLIRIDGKDVEAVSGESVNSTLTANGFRKLMKNDQGISSGSYCAMGVCHCCMIEINGMQKMRACQTIVTPGMKIRTSQNRVMQDKERQNEQ